MVQKEMVINKKTKGYITGHGVWIIKKIKPNNILEPYGLGLVKTRSKAGPTWKQTKENQQMTLAAWHSGTCNNGRPIINASWIN